MSGMVALKIRTGGSKTPGIISLDAKYIENWSLELDIKILLKTFSKILNNKDAC